MRIRKAQRVEHQKLTEISFESKGFWNYPAQYFDKWRDELTITADYIDQNSVFVAESENVIAGYCSIVHLDQDVEVAGIAIDKGFWLEHLFILPGYIGNRIGTALISHLVSICSKRNISEIRVLADPNSSGFYEKMGFEYLKEYPSTIPGRTTPLLIKIIAPGCHEQSMENQGCQ